MMFPLILPFALTVGIADATISSAAGLRIALMCILFPLVCFISGIGQCFMKACLNLTSLRIMEMRHDRQESPAEEKANCGFL